MSDRGPKILSFSELKTKQANSNKTDYFRIKQRNLSVARLEGREEAVGNERCGNCSGTGKCDCTYCGGIGRAAPLAETRRRTRLLEIPDGHGGRHGQRDDAAGWRSVGRVQRMVDARACHDIVVDVNEERHTRVGDARVV